MNPNSSQVLSAYRAMLTTRSSEANTRNAISSFILFIIYLFADSHATGKSNRLKSRIGNELVSFYA